MTKKPDAERFETLLHDYLNPKDEDAFYTTSAELRQFVGLLLDDRETLNALRAAGNAKPSSADETR